VRFFPGDAQRPSRVIALDCDGSISFDVVRWLSEQDIPLVFLGWQGDVVSVIGDQGPYDPDVRREQRLAIDDGRGLKLSRQLIRQKIEASQTTLMTFGATPKREVALTKLDIALEELDAMPPTLEEVRMIEARAALAYFSLWQEVVIHWKGTGRKPIPPRVATSRAPKGSPWEYEPPRRAPGSGNPQLRLCRIGEPGTHRSNCAWAGPNHWISPCKATRTRSARLRSHGALPATS
jgi:CRISPR associated protein Cas1